VTAIHGVLDAFGTKFPQWQAQGYEIAGFAWFQGHRDIGSAVHASRYEYNLVNYIKAIRAEFEVPKAPFVIATIAFNGWDLAGNGLTIAEGQLAVSGTTGKYPEFAGNVLTVESRDYWREAAISPKDQDYHYNWNAETYVLVGESLGRGMVELLQGSTQPSGAGGSGGDANAPGGAGFGGAGGAVPAPVVEPPVVGGGAGGNAGAGGGGDLDPPGNNVATGLNGNTAGAINGNNTESDTTAAQSAAGCSSAGAPTPQRAGLGSWLLLLGLAAQFKRRRTALSGDDRRTL
jgi:hypothetical protein